MTRKGLKGIEVQRWNLPYAANTNIKRPSLRCAAQSNASTDVFLRQHPLGIFGAEPTAAWRFSQLTTTWKHVVRRLYLPSSAFLSLVVDLIK